MNTKIEVLKDGPLIVDNSPKLTNSKDKEIAIDDKIALCRCGASANKPFCDGSHKKVGFSGKRETVAPLTDEKEYKGEKITLYYNGTICCHAGECVSNLGSVFDINSDPWINPDRATTVNEIIEVVKKCPSGALSYNLDNVHKRDFDRKPEIKISKNGPYDVVGNIELNVYRDLKPPSQEHYSLCRCGNSKNKPYCDGSHGKINFIDDEN